MTHPRGIGRRTVVGAGLAWLAMGGVVGRVTVAWAGDVVDRYPWLEEWVTQDGMDRAWLNHLLADLPPYSIAIEAMDRQAEAKPYYIYRQLFLRSDLINKGRERMARKSPTNHSCCRVVSAKLTVSPRAHVCGNNWPKSLFFKNLTRSEPHNFGPSTRRPGRFFRVLLVFAGITAMINPAVAITSAAFGSGLAVIIGTNAALVLAAAASGPPTRRP